MKRIVVIAHNIRSAHNVGAIFRTADGFGVEKVILSGYTPAPPFDGDTRLPHITAKVGRDIHKTALGAENAVPFLVIEHPPLEELRREGYCLVALEQAPGSTPLPDYHPPERVALLLGEEINGISPDLLDRCHDIVEIPMVGTKESFNVSVAAAVALYQLACIEYN